MTFSAPIWLLFNILSLIILAFYSMSEMACVSFNRVRLHYYMNKGVRSAIFLNWLLQNPTRLFGTTLIMVNLATFVGSECAREFHAALGIDPDWSPLSQVLIVIIFGELAPMFAARRYAEHVGMLAAPLLYLSARLMTPFLWAIGGITSLCKMIVGGQEGDENIFITQEELQKILEEKDEESPVGVDSDEFNAVSANIFALSHKDVRQVMEPITVLPRVPSNATVVQAGNAMLRSETDYVAVYHKDIHNIVGIARARDLIRAQDHKRVRDFSTPPWFVTQATSLMQILIQFRKNNQELGIILNKQGQAEGVIYLDHVLEALFGKFEESSEHKPVAVTQVPFIERTLPGGTKVGDFNARFGVILDDRIEMTLSDLVTDHLGHHPEVGETVVIGSFELSVEEASLLDIKSVKITSR